MENGGGLKLEDTPHTFFASLYEHSKHKFFLQDFWDWSWQELAMYDAAEMIHNVNMITSSKIFIVGHSQVPTTFLFTLKFAFFSSLPQYVLLLFACFTGNNHNFGWSHPARYSRNGSGCCSSVANNVLGTY